MSVSLVTQDTESALNEEAETAKKALVPEIKTLLWRMSTRRFDTTRPEWIYGQVTVASETPYRVRKRLFACI